MAIWVYDDWDDQPSDADSLARLLLHIKEVRAQLMDTDIQGNRVGGVPLGYYESLKEDKRELKKKISRAAGKLGRNRAYFSESE